MLKLIARSVLHENHYNYLRWYKTRLGYTSALFSFAKMLISRDNVASIPIPHESNSVFIRPNTSDQDVFDEIFINQEYRIEAQNPIFIIDAGAHIGLASIFFASSYPEAVIVSIEPELSNFELLVRNIKPYSNIRPMNAGLWSHKTTLSLQNPEAATWSFRFTEGIAGKTISSVSIDDIMQMYGSKHIDILKIDIEGAEKEVFLNSSSWIDKVDTIIVEPHDRFCPGCTEVLENVAKAQNFYTSISEESLVLTRTRK